MKIYISKTDHLENDDIFKKLYNEASIERREKIDRLKFKKNKIQSLASWHLLKDALYEHSLDIKKLEFYYNKHGKPFIKDKNIYFSLSHSENRVMCAIDKNPVGCDVEKIKSRDISSLINVFTPSEKEIIGNNVELFYEMWTYKESYIKLKGESIKNLKDFEIVKEDNIFKISQNRDKNNYCLKKTDLNDGYIYSYCFIE